MTRFALPLLAAAAVLLPAAAGAQTRFGGHHDPDVTGSIGGRAPWSQPWEYDSGSDNDKHPSRPYYQQGRGQQTGGPSRNLLPGDGFNLSPR
ncbi:hypothetical protein [Enterovirga sp.]|jgi:hypothetical protein|uniref:hypothetical protein n=1 Tax=Enterovirga sp. TaxID=2026350 RepID=UPI00262BF4F8|nr:hypothetical protein [Enterovirga sp.]MDB5590124.1 hypothetical protein [Enterovirga sp.]